MVGILYESNEWSDWKLRHELQSALAEPVAMLYTQDENCVYKACECDLLVSRVFASAVFRGHGRSEHNMQKIITKTAQLGIPMVNSARAHGFEISKVLAAKEMQKAGLHVPVVLDLGTPTQLAERASSWRLPSIIKPDRGGRATYTKVLHDVDEALSFLQAAPDIAFIVEDYIESRAGFMTRVELIDSKPVLIVKRSISANGLSSYHEGSQYEMYPDCPQTVLDDVCQAAKALSIEFGSFDVIESKDGKTYMIDANSVSNVSEDCTQIFEGFDMMKEYALALAMRKRNQR